MHNTAKLQEEDLRNSQEILGQLRPFTQGVYIMPAFGRYDLVAGVLDVLPLIVERFGKSFMRDQGAPVELAFQLVQSR